ncbi:THAP domain-containing protein 5-like [Vanessa tameamea]|uniref:THAP domain-containing protein 5-like n=1 Tax=Vanessa tameamea TaxID=334116 RepID=A0A8B8ING5_VANTA
MTICAIKVCRNYKGRLKTTKKVTFHRVPNDPILKSRWIEIIKKSRGEDNWQPAKTTVVCSEHFRSRDLYFVNNEGRRRLKKEAVPCKALFLSSVKSDDESEDFVGKIVKIEKISDCETNTLEDTKPLGIIVEGSIDVKKENQDDSSLCTETSDKTRQDVTPPSPKGFKPWEVISCQIGDGQQENNETEKKEEEEEEDFSDLDSVYDSPQRSKMRHDLRRRIKLQKKHVLKIQSLRRTNLRLKKTVASLKQVIETLKKEKN